MGAHGKAYAIKFPGMTPGEISRAEAQAGLPGIHLAWAKTQASTIVPTKCCLANWKEKIAWQNWFTSFLYVCFNFFPPSQIKTCDDLIQIQSLGQTFGGQE